MPTASTPSGLNPSPNVRGDLHNQGRVGASAPHDALAGGNQMKYMLLVYSDEQVWDETAREECYRDSARLAREINACGQYLGASPLHPTSTATSVRVRGGKRLVTDGPFAETREQLGGYYLIDVQDLDQAIEIAARIPGAGVGTIEIRPVMEIEGLPSD
jgi:hypothetical protein